MDPCLLSDADWSRLRPLLPGRRGTPGRTGEDNRRFLEAIKWRAYHGGAWRALPARFGSWNTVWRRCDRWGRAGVWQRLFDHFQDPDLDWLLLGSTADRGTRPAAGHRAAPPPKAGPA